MKTILILFMLVVSFFLGIIVGLGDPVINSGESADLFCQKIDETHEGRYSCEYNPDTKKIYSRVPVSNTENPYSYCSILKLAVQNKENPMHGLVGWTWQMSDVLTGKIVYECML